MEFTSTSCLINGELTVTCSQGWTDTSARLRGTAGQMIANLNWITIGVECISLVVTRSLHLEIILRGGLYYDAGQAEG